LLCSGDDAGTECERADVPRAIAEDLRTEAELTLFLTPIVKREKNITRFDYGKTHGWWVRFQRSTEAGTKRVLSKMFSDAVHGGKAKALRAAIAWRDRTSASIRPARRRRMPPSYGYVRRTELARRAGTSPVYLAWIRMPNGRAASTSFSIAKWGVREAKRRCALYLARKRREAART
jgi:hypothetical protein